MTGLCNKLKIKGLQVWLSNYPVFFPLLDLDECESGLFDCDPDYGVCVNTVGSYQCTCNDGMQLSHDRVYCEGKPDWM